MTFGRRSPDARTEVLGGQAGTRAARRREAAPFARLLPDFTLEVWKGWDMSTEVSERPLEAVTFGRRSPDARTEVLGGQAGTRAGRPRVSRVQLPVPELDRGRHAPSRVTHMISVTP